MIGITSYGAYIPRLRLERSAIYQSMGWFAPALIAVAQGERGSFQGLYHRPKEKRH